MIRSSLAGPPIPPDTLDRLARAKRLIEWRYASPLDVARLAREACFSRFHFIRLFRDAFHQTPYQCLKDRRLARAKELLAYTDLPVTEVCFEVGFQSLGSFSTLFRKEVGQSPAEYRARVASAVAAPPKSIPGCFLEMLGVPCPPPPPRPDSQIRNFEEAA
jgi:AraC-like DNA-binding protein